MVRYAGPAGSTRMMRAPRSANSMASRGSGPMPPSSSTVTPASGPVVLVPGSPVTGASLRLVGDARAGQPGGTRREGVAAFVARSPVAVAGELAGAGVAVVGGGGTPQSDVGG